jgi:hypothetical protein
VLTAPVILPGGTPVAPSATLLAAQQLTDEADRDQHGSRGLGPYAADQRRRRQRAVLAQRRADRSRAAEG